MKHILILSSARSGSNYLSKILGTLPGCISLGEIYKPTVELCDIDPLREFSLCDLTSLHAGLKSSLSEQRPTPIRFARNILATLHETCPSYILVTKLFVEHLASGLAPRDYGQEIVNTLNEYPVSCICSLKRDSLLDTYVSDRLARQSSNWFGSSYGNVSLESDLKDYLQWRDWIIKSWKKGQEMARSLCSEDFQINLCYDEIIRSPSDCINNIAYTCGISSWHDFPVKVNSSRQKTAKTLDYFVDSSIMKPHTNDSLSSLLSSSHF